MSKCVSCNGDLQVHRSYDFRTSRFRNVYKNQYIYKCLDCGLNQADVEFLDDPRLSDYYANEYRSSANIAVLGDISGAIYRQRAAALADVADQNLCREPRRLFEVGAGYGFNLHELIERYPNAVAMTDEVSSIGAAHHGERILRGQLSDGNYDVIILSHVLEHFSDPLALLERARQGLADGGVIVLEVPNDVAGIVPYNGCDEPHLTFFEIEPLRKLLLSAKLEIVELFVAGPNNIPDTRQVRLRRKVRRILSGIPGVEALLDRRAAGRISAGAGYRTRNPAGMFLRAVLRKP